MNFYNNFAPGPGKINLFYTPGVRDIRADTHVYSGCEVPPNYISMIAKLIVTGATREIAITRMIRALKEFIVRGGTTRQNYGLFCSTGTLQYSFARDTPRSMSGSSSRDRFTPNSS